MVIECDIMGGGVVSGLVLWISDCIVELSVAHGHVVDDIVDLV